MASANKGPKPHFVNNLATPEGRLCFPHLDKPSSIREGAAAKYGIEILIPKNSNIDKLKAAILECAKAAFGEFQPRGSDGKPVGKPRPWKLSDFGAEELPIKDGDAKATEMAAADKNGEAYRGHFYIRARSSRKPTVVGPTKENIPETDVYGGAYGRLVMSCMSYRTEKGNKPATTFLLDAVQFTRDGDRFGGGDRAATLGALPDDQPPPAEGDGPGAEPAAEGGNSLFD
jgi:hypothetical protein